MMIVRRLPDDDNARLAQLQGLSNQDRFRFVRFDMTEADARKLEVASAEAPHMLAHAANIFDLIGTSLSLSTAEDSHLISVAEVSALAFRHYAATDAQVLDTLSAAVRSRNDAEATDFTD